MLSSISTNGMSIHDGIKTCGILYVYF